jgi:purine-nucleoside phosphorylase
LKPEVADRGPILILSAFAPELVPVRRLLKRAAIPSARVTCVAAGIGVVDAAAGAARAIAACAPRFVLFIGTAGSYGAVPPIGGVAIARHVLLASSAVARGDGYLPGPLVTRVTTDARWRWGLVAAGGGGGATATVVVGDVATPLAITKAAALARRLARATGAAVENLEAFGVARAAHRAGVPFGAVLGISNRVGPRAHEEWVRHQDRATRAASEVAGALLLSVPAR